MRTGVRQVGWRRDDSLRLVDEAAAGIKCMGMLNLLARRKGKKADWI